MSDNVIGNRYVFSGAFVYRREGQTEVRRKDREDSTPFAEVEALGRVSELIGVCHAVLGDDKLRVGIVYPNLVVLAFQNYDIGGVGAFAMQLKADEFDKDLPLSDNAMLHVYNSEEREGIYDFVLTETLPNNNQIVWRASIGEGYGAGYEQGDEDE